jgi:hypothetical protein
MTWTTRTAKATTAKTATGQDRHQFLGLLFASNIATTLFTLGASLSPILTDR